MSIHDIKSKPDSENENGIEYNYNPNSRLAKMLSEEEIYFELMEDLNSSDEGVIIRM